MLKGLLLCVFVKLVKWPLYSKEGMKAKENEQYSLQLWITPNLVFPKLPHSLLSSMQCLTLPPSPVTSSRCLPMWVMTRVYLCVHEKALENVCPDGTTLEPQILPHLIWGGTQAMGTRQENTQQLWVKEKQISVCQCVFSLPVNLINACSCSDFAGNLRPI